jgi:sulfite reductase (NADPH) hemoprotein beta-component
MPETELLAISKPCLRVYNRYGRRDNKYKARIKILVHETGRGRISAPTSRRSTRG